MSIPNRPVSSIDIVEELGHGEWVLGLTDEDVVALADITPPPVVSQLDLEGKSAMISDSRRTTGEMANLNVWEFFDSPTLVGNFTLYVDHEIYSASYARASIDTGVFPEGSTLTIVLADVYIRGAGGRGGSGSRRPNAGGDCIVMRLPTIIDITEGYIWSGGGGGGPAFPSGYGGGGAGRVGGSPGGTLTRGGGGGGATGNEWSGRGGAPGASGGSGSYYGGARAGYAVLTNGFELTWVGDHAPKVRGYIA